MNPPFDKQQLSFLRQLITNRNKELRHEVSDHLDNALPLKKLTWGEEGDMIRMVDGVPVWGDILGQIYASFAGMVTPYAGTSAPPGALECYGQAISRTMYATLFARVGTTFGSGDGVTTFNVPDLRGRVWAGVDSLGGVDAGRLSWTNQHGIAGGAEFNAAHKHWIPSFYGTNSGSAMEIDWRTAGGIAHFTRYGGLIFTGIMAAGNWKNAPDLSGGVETYVVAASDDVNPSGVVDANLRGRMQPTILGNYIIWTGEKP